MIAVLRALPEEQPGTAQLFFAAPPRADGFSGRDESARALWTGVTRYIMSAVAPAVG